MSGNSVALLARQARAIDGPLPCRREDPRLWFSDSPADLDVARAHCRPCPLRGPCLAGAIERREPSGVWGGEIFARGAIIERKRPRGRPRRQLLQPSPRQVVDQGRDQTLERRWRGRTEQRREPFGDPGMARPEGLMLSRGSGFHGLTAIWASLFTALPSIPSAPGGKPSPAFRESAPELRWPCLPRSIRPSGRVRAAQGRRFSHARARALAHRARTRIPGVR